MPDNWWNYPISNNILLKKGNVVNADSSMIRDVMIQDGIISGIGRVIEPNEDTLVLDTEGMYIIPGGIDPNTHFDYEFMDTKTIDNFYYGTRAAISGGTTTIIDFVIPEVGGEMTDAFQKRKRVADKDVCCDYALHMTLNWWNKNIAKEMGQVVLGCGINSFMLYMSYRDLYMLTDSEIYQACLRCRQLGALAMIHPQNGSIVAENVQHLLECGVKGPEGHYLSRPVVLEAEGTNRACVIANQVNCPLYICNVMSESAANVIKEKKKENYMVYGETTAAALGSTRPSISSSFRVIAAHITNPPINGDPKNPTKLMKLLTTEVLSTAASNNCTFSSDQKSRGVNNFSKIPHGVNGVEDRMSVIWEKGVNAGILSPSQFVAITSTNAAKLFNLYPKKGAIEVGSDADIVVWNPNKFKMISQNNHRQAADYNIFHGMKIRGGPDYVFVRGKLCVDGDVLRVYRGFGQYLCTPSHSPMLYAKHTISPLQQDDFADVD